MQPTTPPAPSYNGGPRSPQGKQTSAKNAVKHGLSATSIEMLPEEIQLQFLEFHEALQNEFQPATIAEQIQFDQYVFTTFLANRAIAHETTALLKLEKDPENEALQRAHRQAARYHRSLSLQARRYFQALEALQRDRYLHILVQPQVNTACAAEVDIPVTVPMRQLLEKGTIPDAVKIIVEGHQSRYQNELPRPQTAPNNPS
jgi:hypothetical protein